MYRGFAQIVKLRNFFHNGGFEEENLYTIRTIRMFSSIMAANLRNLTICAKPLYKSQNPVSILVVNALLKKMQFCVLPINDYSFFFFFRGHGKDGSMGSLHGKFSLIDLAGTYKSIIDCSDRLYEFHNLLKSKMFTLRFDVKVDIV